MPNGSRRPNAGGYAFVDGRAVSLDASSVAGAAVVPGQEDADVMKSSRFGAIPPDAALAPGQVGGASSGMGGRAQRSEDAPVPAYIQTPEFIADERRQMRTKYIVSAVVLVGVAAFSLCVSTGYSWVIYSPVDVLSCYGCWFQVVFAQISAPSRVPALLADILAAHPMYYDVIATVPDVFRYGVCGVFLALSGMLYQNAFRNPIAAPSMLGVSSGINVALLVLVGLFGAQAANMQGLYYLFSYLGGAIVLAIVMLGGKWMSGKGEFNVVNMLLIGTIVMQLSGVAVNYVQSFLFDESAWLVYYNLQAAINIESIFTYISIFIGGLVALVPVVLYRFRLNLISFPDDETRLLGVNATGLRLLALGCGSLMILTAQVNAGQVAMVSLVVPFVVRAAYGSEFRKQFAGNVFVGAILMLICWDIISYVSFGNFELTLGSVVSIVGLPLFVWMVAVRQRSWE